MTYTVLKVPLNPNQPTNLVTFFTPLLSEVHIYRAVFCMHLTVLFHWHRAIFSDVITMWTKWTRWNRHLSGSLESGGHELSKLSHVIRASAPWRRKNVY